MHVAIENKKDGKESNGKKEVREVKEATQRICQKKNFTQKKKKK